MHFDPLYIALGLALWGLVSARRSARLMAKALSASQDESTRLRAKQKDLMRKERARVEAIQSEIRSQQDGKSDSRDNVVGLALSLPGIVRELNRHDLDPATIPSLILNLADSIFRPGQMLLYLSRPSRMIEGGRELCLVESRGLEEIPGGFQVIPFGEGKIGWVAENKLEKLKSDWSSLNTAASERSPDANPLLDFDILGPLVHHGVDGEQVLGVLSIGRPAVLPANPKLMFQMVTSLGSLAWLHAMNVKRLRQQANTDGLTGLLNKRYFMQLITERLVADSQTAQRLAVFIFDIDHFKTYNDTNGHPAGDHLLRTLAALLKQSVRPQDICCRYGGEEFMVAMPDTNEDDALKLADSVRSAIEQEVFEYQHSQPNGNLTISGGVAVYPLDATNLEELIQRADESLYESKRRGRNRVARYRGSELGDQETTRGDQSTTDFEWMHS